MKRLVLVAVGAYLVSGLIGLALEHSGSSRCFCREDCWCKRPGLGLFRWVFPFRHSGGC